MRWMHVTPGKQIIGASDRQGLMIHAGGRRGERFTGQPVGSARELHARRHHLQRNNPSILFYECGNTGITESR